MDHAPLAFMLAPMLFSSHRQPGSAGQHPRERRSPALRLGSLRRWRAARQVAPPGNVLLITLRQWLAERRARAFGARFRHHDNQSVQAAYEMMGGALFRGINARQAWANARTIAKTLHRRAPARPLVALDLACGDGASTATLAHYLPAGSRIIGLEYAQGLAELGRQRAYHDQGGRAADVHIHCASILEPFLGDDGQPLAAASVDWINCSGALAHHFMPAQLQIIAIECARVLRPGGWAAVDTRSPSAGDPVVAAFIAAGLQWQGHERSCAFDRYPQCCFQLV